MQTGLELSTRSKLLQAAVTVFGKLGYDGASVRQIADLAGVNHSSIRYHYASKRDLWCATVLYLFDLMESAVHKDEEKWSSATPRELIMNATANFIRFNAKYPEFYKIISFETLNESDRMDWLNESIIRPFTDRAVAVVALAQQQGLYPRDIPALNLHYIYVMAARSIFVFADQIRRNWAIDVFSEAEIERHIDAVLRVLMSAPGSSVEQASPAGAGLA